MTGRRVWTNSWAGRVLTIFFGILLLALTSSESAFVVSASWVLVVVALVAVFTSRLTLDDGVLTARQFFRSRSVRLDEIERVEPAFLLCTGLVIRTSGGKHIRTLVTGELTDFSLGTSRVDRLCEELNALAELAHTAPGDVSTFHLPRRSLSSRMRGALTVALILTGWMAAAWLAGWWAHRENIGWALEESGSQGPNYLLIVTLVYGGAVACVALVRMANAEARDAAKEQEARR